MQGKHPQTLTTPSTVEAMVVIHPSNAVLATVSRDSAGVSIDTGKKFQEPGQQEGSTVTTFLVSNDPLAAR